MYLEATPKSGKANYLSPKFQDCFGHSLIDMLRSPATRGEVLALNEGLRSFSEELKRRGIVSAFAFAPADDAGLGSAFVASGLRKTDL